MMTDYRREPSSKTSHLDRRLLLLLVIVCILSGCDRQWQQQYKAGVLGDWEEVRGTQEFLHFNADGILIMNGPAEHHTCRYEFPDRKHIRLECVVPNSTDTAQTYGFAFADGKLLITDSDSTGTYRRREPSTGASPSP